MDQWMRKKKKRMKKGVFPVHWGTNVPRAAWVKDVSDGTELAALAKNAPGGADSTSG